MHKLLLLLILQNNPIISLQGIVSLIYLILHNYCESYVWTYFFNLFIYFIYKHLNFLSVFNI